MPTGHTCNARCGYGSGLCALVRIWVAIRDIVAEFTLEYGVARQATCGLKLLYGCTFPSHDLNPSHGN